MNEKILNIIMKTCWLVVYSALVILFVPMLAGFAAGGFEITEVFQKFIFYQSAFYLLGIIAIYIIGNFLKDSDKFGGAIIHDPDKSPSLFSFFKVPRVIKNPVLFFILCWLIFSPFLLYASQQNTFFSGIPKLEQQFTPTGQVIFSVYPASPSETLGAVFLLSLYLLLLRIFTKGRLSKGVYIMLAIVGGAILSGLYGYLNHLMRYSYSDIAMTNVIIFWVFGGLLTVIFNSVIPFLVLHDVNNLFSKIIKLFSSDKVLGITISLLIILSIIFIFLLIWTRKKKVS